MYNLYPKQGFTISILAQKSERFKCNNIVKIWERYMLKYPIVSVIVAFNQLVTYL